jgi:hypothetical protein
MSINELFGTNNANVTTNARSLPGTTELTNVAHNLAVRIMKAMEGDIEAYRPRIQKSAVDAKELDAIIDELADYSIIADDSILRHLDDDMVESMLKSQQSKRSRSKSKAMTLDNYITLMTAAIAEDILRTIYNKPKSAGGYHRTTGTVDYTGAQLEALAADQEALKREIRNIQSKKSIMKSKEGFSESDERWLALLKAEQQLKDLRIGGHSTVVEVDKTKDALSELLAGRDISKMKSAEAHELLETIAKMAAGEVPTDNETVEEIQ